MGIIITIDIVVYIIARLCFAMIFFVIARMLLNVVVRFLHNSFLVDLLTIIRIISDIIHAKRAIIADGICSIFMTIVEIQKNAAKQLMG